MHMAGWQSAYKTAECLKLFSSSAMDKSLLLVLFCLQAFLLITAFTYTDAAALGKDGTLRLAMLQRRPPAKKVFHSIRMTCWEKPGGCSAFDMPAPVNRKPIKPGASF
ncbi:hypothetical protein D9C73_014158 [Collichthys lucidus]|uniref:Uncharacterized protein n=1 Tax=Collichthys lucidus TaxID=240159 RepID=A0A4V6AT06_COLLU|nr:hypothetical protein D9C73_014158 [Collichthys lucidus]